MKIISIFIGGLIVISTLLFTWCAIKINKGENKNERINN